MLRHRERMEENGIAPLTWEDKLSAAAAPDAEVVDKPTRRQFSPSYKLRVVEEADRCTEPGEVVNRPSGRDVKGNMTEDEGEHMLSTVGQAHAGLFRGCPRVASGIAAENTSDQGREAARSARRGGLRNGHWGGTGRSP